MFLCVVISVLSIAQLCKAMIYRAPADQNDIVFLFALKLVLAIMGIFGFSESL